MKISMTTFTKWFLLNSVMFTTLVLMEQKGTISTIIKNDLSYISIVIMLLYVAVSAFVGKLCYLSDKIKDGTVGGDDDRAKLSKRADIGWFAAEHFFSLGLLGTIIGLVIATDGSLDSSLPTSEIVAGLKEGLNTSRASLRES